MRGISFIDFLVIILSTYSITTLVITMLDSIRVSVNKITTFFIGLFSAIISTCLFALVLGSYVSLMVIAVAGALQILLKAFDGSSYERDGKKTEKDIVQGLISFIEDFINDNNEREKKRKLEMNSINDQLRQLKNFIMLLKNSEQSAFHKPVADNSCCTQSKAIADENTNTSQGLSEEYVRQLLEKQELKFLRMINGLKQSDSHTKGMQAEDEPMRNNAGQTLSQNINANHEEIIMQIEKQGYKLSPYLRSQLIHGDKTQTDL